MNNIKDLLIGEPSFLSGDDVKIILVEDLCRVYPKLWPQVGGEYGPYFELDGLKAHLQKKFPHRLVNLEAWLEERRAKVAPHNAKVAKLLETKIAFYMKELSMDLERATVEARFDVIAWLAGGERQTRPAYLP